MGIGVFLFTFLIIPLLTGSVMLHYHLQSRQTSTWQPVPLSDMLHGLLAAVFFGIMQYTVETYSYPWFYRNSKETVNEEIRVKKAKKSSSVFFKWLWYIFIVAWEFYFFKDAPWWPTFLGGSC